LGQKGFMLLPKRCWLKNLTELHWMKTEAGSGYFLLVVKDDAGQCWVRDFGQTPVAMVLEPMVFTEFKPELNGSGLSFGEKETALKLLGTLCKLSGV
jgi:hypothetical protein